MEQLSPDTTTTEPVLLEPQLLKPSLLEPVPHKKRSHHNEKPAHQTREQTPMMQQEQSLCGNKDSGQPKMNK